MELHCPVHVVKVGEKNNTAAAASAYIARNQTQGHDGRQHDYSYKSGFIDGGFLFPDNVPERWKEDPQKLWAEQDYLDYEKSTRRGPNSELYRSGRIGIPWDAGYDGARKVVEEALEPLRERGMVIQWALHDEIDPETKKRNLHVHWMAAMREVTPEGFGKKNRDWNKYNGGLNIPKLIRPIVADVLNRELQTIGSDVKVEHESFEARGIDKIPQVHMGPAASALEKNRYKKNGELQRAAIKTEKGNRNRYIKWLNQIHAENLKEVETALEAKSVGLDAVIQNTKVQLDGNQAFKDWDALFAMVRDTRRCRAALQGEIKKLDKILGAYARMDEAETEEDREKERRYIAWAGCDPDDIGWKQVIQDMQHEARLGIKEMDLTEEYLMSSKELLKAHNKVVYTAKKESWDIYLANRHLNGIAYCENRLESIDSYKDYLTRNISIFDWIFRTAAWDEHCEEMRRLRELEDELRNERWQHKAELKQAKKDAKIHKAEAKQAAREEKKVIREQKKKKGNDGAR